ncbi:MAG: ZIP family metal transporter [Synergistota bacterium]|nr:ZIP family metal transporter [Synergistota bacterium]
MGALFNSLPALWQAMLAGVFTWGVTALGAAAVFAAIRPSRKFLDTMLGFAAGVMIAASYWSLLAPAISLSEDIGYIAWLPPAVGFLLGGGFLRLLDIVVPHLHPGLPASSAEGPPSSLHKTTLLVLAITLHNIPEGLAIGVAFGAAASGLPGETAGAAAALALGIGIQNFPEGMAVSIPLLREGFSPRKSFFYGQISGIVEPVSAVAGALAVLIARPLLPFALAFAAGAMIFVVVEDVVPESQNNGNSDIATMGVLAGFTLMMILDVALG